MKGKLIVSADYEKALNIDRQIKVNAQMAQSCLYEVCKGLKEMRDGKLYKELGYQNFDDYSEQEIGIKRRQAYCYISIVENLPSDFVQSTAQIGTQKLYLLSRIDEQKREEIIEKTDLENTSVKELEKEIAKQKAENQKLLEKNQKQAEKLDKVSEENEILSERLEELENKPVDVAVADNSHELDNMRKAMAKCDLEWREAYDKLQEENLAEARNHKQEIAQIKAEYEQKLAEIPKTETVTVTDSKEIFKAYLANAVDSSKRLVEFIKSQNDNGFYIEKSAEFFNKMMEELK